MKNFSSLFSADYKTSARRNADVKLEVSGAVRRTSATCAGVKNSLGSDEVRTSENLRNTDETCKIRRKMYWSELECCDFAKWS